MPSLRARLLSLAVRALVRRRRWGDEQALARRARAVFGAPRFYGALVSLGVRREPFEAGTIRGEWCQPSAPRPGIVLYVHGGGFVSGSFRTHRPIAAALARLSRLRVLSVDYRLAPEHRFPAALDDVHAAYESLLAVSPPGEAIALAGDSAGGNLVIGLALRLARIGRRKPSCVVAFSPWTDLAGSGASARANDGADPMFRYENLADFAAAYLRDASPLTPEASPLYGALDTLPPLLQHVGSSEILLDDARRVHERILAAGGRSQLEVYDQMAHGWQMLVPWVPEATASLRAAARFIAEHTLASQAMEALPAIPHS